MEFKLKQELLSKSKHTVYESPGNGPKKVGLTEILTSREIFEQQIRETPQLLYYRMPIKDEQSPPEEV